MTPQLIFISSLVAFVATFLAVPLVRGFALRGGLVDKPDGERKLHSGAVPNIGGIAIFGGFIAGLVALWIGQKITGTVIALPHWAFFVGAVLILATGIYDDVKEMGFKVKFLMQVIVAYGLMFAGYRLDVSFLFFVGDDPFAQALYSTPITMLWIVGVMNAVNLIDGLDGLASGLTVIALAFFALIFALSGSTAGLVAVTLIAVGMYAGFLVHNFPPASIFLGDSGSLLAGYLLAVLSLEGMTFVDPSLALLICGMVVGVPIVDTSVCMLRRMIEGRSPFAADHDHIHHRLSVITTRKNATLILYAAATWFGLAALLITQFPALIGLLIGVVTVASAVLGVRSLGYESINKAMSLRGYMRPAIIDLFGESASEITVVRSNPSSKASDSYPSLNVETTVGAGDGSTTKNGKTNSTDEGADSARNEQERSSYRGRNADSRPPLSRESLN